MGVLQGLVYPPTPAVYRLCRVTAPPVPPCLSPGGWGGRAEPPPPGRAPPPRPTLVLPLTEQYLGLGVRRERGLCRSPFLLWGLPTPVGLFGAVFSLPPSPRGAGWGPSCEQGRVGGGWAWEGVPGCLCGCESSRLISVPWTGPPAPGCVPGGIIVPVPGVWHCHCPWAVSPTRSTAGVGGTIPIPGLNCTTVFTLFYPRSTAAPPGLGAPPGPEWGPPHFSSGCFNL